MLAAAAIVWITLDADVGTPAARVGRGWTIGLEGRASFRPLFVYPDYQSGILADGGFRLAHVLRRDTTFALTGRAGATYVDDWRPIFEAAADVSWRDVVELRAGLRHDDRLRREGPLSDFRDPTGRFFLGARTLPFRKGLLSAGAAIEYERALPGTGRLPSGVSVTAVARVRAGLK
jgi:hypothetical protein